MPGSSDHMGCARLLGAPGSLHQDGWQGERRDLYKGISLQCWAGKGRGKVIFLPLGGLGTNPARYLHAGPMFLAAWDSGLASLAHQKWELGKRQLSAAIA